MSLFTALLSTKQFQSTGNLTSPRANLPPWQSEVNLKMPHFPYSSGRITLNYIHWLLEFPCRIKLQLSTVATCLKINPVLPTFLSLSHRSDPLSKFPGIHHLQSKILALESLSQGLILEKPKLKTNIINKNFQNWEIWVFRLKRLPTKCQA